MNEENTAKKVPVDNQQRTEDPFEKVREVINIIDQSFSLLQLTGSILAKGSIKAKVTAFLTVFQSNRMCLNALYCNLLFWHLDK